MWNIQDLLENQKFIDERWVIARPEKQPFLTRLKGAIFVLLGYCDAIEFYQQ